MKETYPTQDSMSGGGDERGGAVSTLRDQPQDRIQGLERFRQGGWPELEDIRIRRVGRTNGASESSSY